MQTPPSHRYPQPASRGTATSSPAFVETVEYSRFVEFCDCLPSLPLHRTLLWTAWYWENTLGCPVQPSGKDHRARSVDERNDRRPSNRHSAVHNFGGQHSFPNLAGHQYGEGKSDGYRARPSPARGERCPGGAQAQRRKASTRDPGHAGLHPVRLAISGPNLLRDLQGIQGERAGGR